MPSEEELELMAQTLCESGDFRVLRKLRVRDRSVPDARSPFKIGVLLDVETTGLDTGKDEIIELGMVKFAYLPGGQILSLIDTFGCFQQPSSPIPREVIDLTGITDDMVSGHSIDPQAVVSFVQDAAVLIAHNANFDRRFCERYWPIFIEKHWACSASQIQWRALGFEGSRLSYLLAGCGYFHDAHRAVDDCLALLEILAGNARGPSDTRLGLLLESARKRTVRVWAESAPFDLKGELKKRKYRWNDGNDGRPKSWYADIDEGDLECEIKFLKEEIYRRDISLHREVITSLNRFSVRG
jgi:DNA polymerase-3 subunit epsilon